MKKTKKILWCPQHTPTQEQVKELSGEIYFLKDVDPKLYQSLSNTGTEDLVHLAFQFKKLWTAYDHVVLPIGSPAFIMVLGDIIPNDIKSKIRFAHSERNSVDIPQPDGTVIKKSVFKHIKFFNPWD